MKFLKINFLYVFALDQPILLEFYIGILSAFFHLLPNYLYIFWRWQVES